VGGKAFNIAGKSAFKNFREVPMGRGNRNLEIGRGTLGKLGEEEGRAVFGHLLPEGSASV